MKRVFLVGVLSLMCSGLYGQQSGFGLKAGANLSNIVDAGDEGNAKLGFYAGAYYLTDFEGGFQLRPELTYSKQGARGEIEVFDLNGNLINQDLTLNYNYINFSVLASFNITDKLSLQVGPQLGVLVLARLRVGDFTENFNDSVDSTDYGINMGVGYLITDHVGMSLRYNLGLNELVDESVRNSVFQLGLDYTF